MSNAIVKYFKLIDIFSPDYCLELDKKTKHQTLQGSIISLLLIVFGCAISFIFGRDVWERKNPLATQNFVTNPVSKINTYRFPLLFVLVNKNFEIIDPDPYFDYYVVRNLGPYTKNQSLQQFFKLNDTDSFFKCELAREFDIYKHSAEEFVNKTFLCPSIVRDKNSFIQNGYFANNSTTFSFIFKKCNKNIRKCADDIDINFEKNTLYFTFIEDIPDSSKYKNHTKSSEKATEMTISSKLQKLIDIRIDKGEIITDEGWFFENMITENFLMTYSIETQYSIIENEDSANIIINLSVSNRSTQIKRTYLKIQELFAKIGGIMNILFILIEFISKSFLRYIYLLDLSLVIMNNNKQNEGKLNEFDFKNESEMQLKPTVVNKLDDINHNHNMILKDNLDQIKDENDFKKEQNLNIELDKNSNLNRILSVKVKNDHNTRSHHYNSYKTEAKNGLINKYLSSNNFLKKEENYENILENHFKNLESNGNWINYFKYLFCSKTGDGKILNLISEVASKYIDISSYIKACKV